MKKELRRVELIMGMPIQIVIKDTLIVSLEINKIFDYFKKIDSDYSPFKDDSEVAKLNRGENVSEEMRNILRLADELKRHTKGFFDIKKPDGRIDPSGVVKGLAIFRAAEMLKNYGYKHFFIDAGGDAEIVGEFRWGIRNPFNKKEIVKVLDLKNCGIATSGIYERGLHIYNPLTKSVVTGEIMSITVIGPNVFEADKISTPAFAMGKEGIEFVEFEPGLEAYMIDSQGIATMTSGFGKYVVK